MPTIYIPSFEHGKRAVLEIVPRWNCFPDRSNPHAVFIDGGHYHEGQLFKSAAAVALYWAKMPVPASDQFTVSELVELWKEKKK